MNRHPLLRAYMAGVLLPSWFLVVVISAFGLAQPGLVVDLDRVFIFAMVAVPNLWGLWNLLYFATGLKRRLPLGAWGAFLPFLIVPIAVLTVRTLGAEEKALITKKLVVEVFPVAVGVYFLVWKFVVAFFNRVVGLE
jgi:hypothetical protein